MPILSTFPIGPFGPLAHACAPENENRGRQQKRRKSKDLEKTVRAIRANRSNPILRWGVVGRGDVKRRILRRIGKQRQRNEDRQRDTQKPNQFVEPLISSRSQ